MHDPTLPDRDLRNHVLASAVRAAEACLGAHGYSDPERGLEVLAYALDETLAEEDEEPFETAPGRVQ